jgi:hypothetical protein
VKLRTFTTRALVAGALCTGTSGCLESFEPDVGEPIVGRCDPEDTDPQNAISFQVDVLPLFTRPSREGGCGCHNAASGGSGYQLSGLDLQSFEGMSRGGRISGSNIVVAGNPCVSDLYLKVTAAPPYGARMPISGPPFLSPDEMRILHDWIAEGASAE